MFGRLQHRGMFDRRAMMRPWGGRPGYNASLHGRWACNPRARLFASVPPLVKISRSGLRQFKSAPRISATRCRASSRCGARLARPMLACRVGISGRVAAGHGLHDLGPRGGCRIMVKIDRVHQLIMGPRAAAGNPPARPRSRPALSKNPQAPPILPRITITVRLGCVRDSKNHVGWTLVRLGRG